MSKHHVSTKINGEPTEFLCEPQLTLLDVLRDELHLTGSKEGCSSGDCGACSVTVDGRLVCSCLMLAVEAEGRAIETIEGMARGHDLHPLQRKFWSTRPCSAASARRACWSPPKPCWTAIRIRPRQRRATGLLATSAGAPATIRSPAPCSMPPAKPPVVGSQRAVTRDRDRLCTLLSFARRYRHGEWILLVGHERPIVAVRARPRAQAPSRDRQRRGRAIRSPRPRCSRHCRPWRAPARLRG